MVLLGKNLLEIQGDLNYFEQNGGLGLTFLPKRLIYSVERPDFPNRQQGATEMKMDIPFMVKEVIVDGRVEIRTLNNLIANAEIAEAKAASKEVELREYPYTEKTLLGYSCD